MKASKALQKYSLSLWLRDGKKGFEWDVEVDFGSDEDCSPKIQPYLLGSQSAMGLSTIWKKIVL